MGGEARDIKEAIRSLSGFDDLMYEATACKVSDIDTVSLTCTCSPIDGSAYLFDVLLNADGKKGFVLIPKDGSVVIVNQVSDANAFVSMVSDVDQIYLAGDVNGGLVKINELTAKLNQLVTQISANFSAIAATYPYTIVPLTPFTPTDYQNTKIQHGNG